MTVKDIVIEEYNNGDGLIKLAKRHKHSVTSIRKFLTSRGVEIRKRGRPKGAQPVEKDTSSVTAETPFNLVQ